MRKTLALLLSAAVGLANTDFPMAPPTDPSVLLVKRKGEAKAVANFHRAQGGKVTRFRHIPWDAVELPTGQAWHEGYRRYRASQLFERVEAQRIYELERTPNDPRYAEQWALAKIEAAPAWDRATSNDVVVAVLDTGIDFTHPDLQANLWTGPQGEHGYTAVNGTIAAGGLDDHYHGTHVAGTIAAVGNNGLGVAGVNWRAKVASFKFLNASGSGTTRDAILCIEKIIELKQAGHNIRVSNNSWGGPGGDAALEEAFLALENHGVLSVCAAGNNASDVDDLPFIPASFPWSGIVAVLASDASDSKAGFSNYGSVSTDLLAPGVDVLSSVTNGGYWFLSGTSMASPHVAGAMAMVFSFNPNLTPQQARTILLHPASFDATSFTGTSTGGGRLNLRKLWNNPGIGNPPPVNQPPVLVLSPNTNLVVIAPGQSVVVSATASDPEGDELAQSSGFGIRLPWPMRRLTGLLWPVDAGASSNRISVTGKDLAIEQKVNLRFSVSDQHGGGAVERVNVWTYRNEARVHDLESAIRGFRVWSDPAGQAWMRLDVDTNYPFVGSVEFDARIYGGSNNRGSSCCYAPNREQRLSANPALIEGSYTIRPLAGDRMGNFATGPAAVYLVSNATARPPELRMTLSTNRGLAPLTVRADMSGSLPGDVTRATYTSLFLDESGFSTDIFNPVREFTLDEPGVYAVQFTVSDFAKPLDDAVVKLFTVLPAWPGKLCVSRSGGNVTLCWTAGVLQEAAAVVGPFADSVDQRSPQTRTAGGTGRFFRVR